MYTACVTYPGGSRSHRLSTISRTEIIQHLNTLLEEKEILALAETVTLKRDDEVLLKVAGQDAGPHVMNTIPWPSCGAKAKVHNPVATTLYMPQSVRAWLTEQGDGKASKGLRKLIELANIPELSDAWRQ